MLKSIIYFAGIYSLFISCNSNTGHNIANDTKDSVVTGTECEKYFAAAKASDDILMRAQVLDKDVAAKAITDFNTFASNCMNDSLAPVF